MLSESLESFSDLNMTKLWFFFYQNFIKNRIFIATFNNCFLQKKEYCQIILKEIIWYLFLISASKSNVQMYQWALKKNA